MFLGFFKWCYHFGFILWNILLYCIDDIKFKLRTKQHEQEENIENEVVIVTGANRGLGKSIALEFAKRKATVILGCRNVNHGQKTLEEIMKETGNINLDVIQLDLTDMNSVEEFATIVSQRYPRIKILVNNAGLAIGSTNNPSMELRNGFNTLMAANHFGHFLLTNLLLEKLLKSQFPKVIVVASTQLLASKLDPDDLTLQKSGFGFFDSLPYSNSKHANCLFVAELAEKLKDSDLKTYAVCPGVIYTDILNQLNLFSKMLLHIGKLFVGNSPSEVARQYVMHMALSKSSNYQSGRIYRFQMPFKKVNTKIENEKDLAKILWQKSSQLVRLSNRLERMKSALHYN